jgi:pyruvate-formate lyase-activating enzyme
MADDTQSLCPMCLATVPARRRTSGKDVFLDKTCPEHGHTTVQIAKDARRFFDKTFDVPGKVFTPVTAFHGHCGEDCGWCDAHRQHVCTGLIEVTDCCDLACPVCYFGEKGKHHLSRDEFRARLDTLLRVESGKLEILQISGGECLTHPDFCGLLDEALVHDIGRIVVNTNGLGFLRNEAAFEKVRANRDRVEVYLQFDGFSDSVYELLRGRALTAEKQAILAKLNVAEIKICLAVTVYKNNLDQIPAILKLACETAHISGVTFQRLTKVGSAEGTAFESVFQEDILLAIAASGMMAYRDMVPLPCSHENCTSLGFLFCIADKVYSVADYVDLARVKRQDLQQARLRQDDPRLRLRQCLRLLRGAKRVGDAGPTEGIRRRRRFAPGRHEDRAHPGEEFHGCRNLRCRAAEKMLHRRGGRRRQGDSVLHAQCAEGERAMGEHDDEMPVGETITAFLVTLLAIPLLFVATCVPVGLVGMGSRHSDIAFGLYIVAFAGFGIFKAVRTRNPGIRWGIIVGSIALALLWRREIVAIFTGHW